MPRYPAWAEWGYITPTPGNIVDYATVEACIRGLCERFDIREIGFDPTNVLAMMGRLTDEVLSSAIVRHGWATQSSVLNKLERVIWTGAVIHGGYPVLRWCPDNVAIVPTAFPQAGGGG